MGLMNEIEVKILGIDLEAVVARLKEVGATPLFDGMVRCVHFDFENDPIRGARSLFRMRRWEGASGGGPGMAGFPSKVEICYKGPKTVVDGCKVREEIETTVADADVFLAMMKKLGFHITLDNEKRRRSYSLGALGAIHVDVDEYPQVPAYLEIEGPNRKAIDEAIATLKLEGCEVSTESADELFARLWPGVDFYGLKF